MKETTWQKGRLKTLCQRPTCNRECTKKMGHASELWRPQSVGSGHPVSQLWPSPSLGSELVLMNYLYFSCWPHVPAQFLIVVHKNPAILQDSCRNLTFVDNRELTVKR